MYNTTVAVSLFSCVDWLCQFGQYWVIFTNVVQWPEGQKWVRTWEQRVRRVTNNHVTATIVTLPMTHSHLQHSSLSQSQIVKHLFGHQGQGGGGLTTESKMYSHLLCVSFSEWMCFGNALVKCASQDSVYFIASSHTRLTHSSSNDFQKTGAGKRCGEYFFFIKMCFMNPKCFFFVCLFML